MATRAERIKRVGEKALYNDSNYAGCAQSVLGALQEEFGIGNRESFRAASMLAGGVARQGETCGAILGALLALGLLVGREKIEDTQAYKDAMPPAVEVRARFLAELKKSFGKDFQNTLCCHLQEVIYGRSFVMSQPDDYQAFLDAGGHSAEGCPKVCAVAARVTAEKILQLI